MLAVCVDLQVTYNAGLLVFQGCALLRVLLPTNAFPDEVDYLVVVIQVIVLCLWFVFFLMAPMDSQLSNIRVPTFNCICLIVQMANMSELLVTVHS